jgi:transcriptional regulator with XRE-family HTH domain
MLAEVAPEDSLQRHAALQDRAAEIARRVSAVEVERPAVPPLTGDLLKDTRAVTGLTLDQVGRAIGVSGRAVASWRTGAVPQRREAFLQMLRSAGLTLVGGLGPAGVQRWFMAGTPTRLDRLAAGDIDEVAAEARAYETSPAT